MRGDALVSMSAPAHRGRLGASAGACSPGKVRKQSTCPAPGYQIRAGTDNKLGFSMDSRAHLVLVCSS
jgi:hypothetical protein